MHTVPKTKADTWDVLAEKLNYERRSFMRWKKLPGAPQEPDEEKWTAFIGAQGLGKSASRNLVAIKTLIAEEQLTLLKRKNEIESGKTISMEEIQDFLRDWAAKLDQVVVSEFGTNAPPQLVGRSIVEIRQRLQEGIARVRAATAKGLLNYKPEEAQQTG